MTKQPHALFLSGLLMLTALTASAAVIVETEAPLTTQNNSTGTAQAIPGSSFTAPSPANVFSIPGASSTATIQGLGGDDDVDFYSFNNTFAGALLYLDVDNNPATFDSFIAVFSPTGTLIGWGDDTNPADPGSASTIDALLGGLPLLQVGTYYIAISQFPNYASAALLFPETALNLGGVSVSGATLGLSTFDFSGAQPDNAVAYTLNATLVTPEPATLSLMGLALTGLAFWKRRR